MWCNTGLIAFDTLTRSTLEEVGGLCLNWTSARVVSACGVSMVPFGAFVFVVFYLNHILDKI